MIDSWLRHSSPTNSTYKSTCCKQARQRWWKAVWKMCSEERAIYTSHCYKSPAFNIEPRVACERPCDIFDFFQISRAEEKARRNGKVFCIVIVLYDSSKTSATEWTVCTWVNLSLLAKKLHHICQDQNLSSPRSLTQADGNLKIYHSLFL